MVAQVEPPLLVALLLLPQQLGLLRLVALLISPQLELLQQLLELETPLEELVEILASLIRLFG